MFLINKRILSIMIMSFSSRHSQFYNINNGCYIHNWENNLVSTSVCIRLLYNSLVWPLELFHKCMYQTNSQERRKHSLGLFVLLKALPPVCMKYTAQDESQVANIARGTYSMRQKGVSSRAVYFHINEVASSVSSVLLYFALIKVSTEYSSLVILTHSLNNYIQSF